MFQALLDACFAGAQGWDIQFCLLTLIALSIAQGIMEHQLGRRQSSLTYVWVVLFMAIISLPVILRELGLEGADEDFGAVVWTAWWFGVAVLARPEVFRLAEVVGERLGFTPRSHATAHAVLDAALLMASAYLALLAEELVWNEEFTSISFYSFFLGWFFSFLLVALLYFLSQRRGGGPALGVVAIGVIGLASFFTFEFKGTILTPCDLFGLGTAAAVAEGYEFFVTPEMVVGAQYLVVGVGMCSWITPAQPRERKSLFQMGGDGIANLACAAACLAALTWAIFGSNLTDDYDIPLDYWNPVAATKENGFIPSFMAKVQDLSLEAPEEYTDEHAAELERLYAQAYDGDAETQARRAEATAQFGTTMPTVICIMNEAYSDLSTYDQLGGTYQGPWYSNSIPDALVRGSLTVDICGGGTCISEYEFLTGNSRALVGAGKIPYAMYDLSSAPSLVKQFSELGYQTTAIHPNLATNWSRDVAYRELGFDQFLDIDDFAKDSPRLHMGITDAVTYDKVLEVVASSDQPQFVFAVTMQNHGGYDSIDVPDDIRDYTWVEGVSEEDNLQLQEYLSCINGSERDLAAFIEQLRQLGQPVVLVFFGDHQPGIMGDINDTLFPNEDETTHSERLYQTSYFVWANYDVAANEQVSQYAPSSAWQLAATTLDAIGAPLTDYQKASVVISRTYPSLNRIGFMPMGGTWQPLDEEMSELPQELRDYQVMEYQEFGADL